MLNQSGKKKHILASYVKKDKISEKELVNTDDKTLHVPIGVDKGVKRIEEFYSYFIYSEKENKMRGGIYLTENQAYQLNQLMKREKAGIAFIRS